MPALVLFGRRWLISSDDVPLPAAGLAAFHLVWCCLLVVWFVSVHGPAECEDAWRFDVGVGGLLASFVASLCLEVALVRHGLRGGPFETRKRRLVPRLVYLDFASHVCQVAFNGYCTYLVYAVSEPRCEGEEIWNPFAAMMALVWCTWAFVALLLGLLIFTYNMFPDYRDPKSWEARCTCVALMCCCSNGADSRGHYRDPEAQPQRLSARLGNVFAIMLSHIDLSPSDMLLAFTLAMHLQRIQRRRQKRQLASQHGSSQLGSGDLSSGDLDDGGGGLGSAEGVAAAAGVAGAAAAAPAQQQQQQGSQPAGSTIQLSEQDSPEPAGSVCSTDGLLGPDLEAGLLRSSSRSRAAGGARGGAAQRSNGAAWGSTGAATAAAAGAAAGAAGAAAGHEAAEEEDSEVQGRLESFLPARPVGSKLQLGAAKTETGPEGEPEPGDTHAGEQGAVDAETVIEAAWAMRYAFAAYGVLLFIFSRPATGCLQLCCGRNCGLLIGTAQGRRRRKKLDLRLVHNLNREATQQAAGLADRDLLDVRYEGDAPGVLPYFLGVDEKRRALVLAIRGSLSLDDVVRDLLFEPVSLDEWLQPGRSWEEPPPPIAPAGPTTRYAAHAGILEAARATFLDLQEHGVLHDALLAPEGRCHGWKLVLAGHSLGAGCAFLLALYLRQFFPDLKCWCFSPPGGLASWELCASTTEWCHSVVCGKEWIPRLSVRTFGRMRDEMVFAALRCRRPKWVVLLGLMSGKRWSERELFYPPDELPMEARQALREYEQSLQRSAEVRRFNEMAGNFGPPGRCIHLKPTGHTAVTSRRALGLRRTKQRRYRAVYIDGQAVIDEGVIIGGRMMADHMPDYLLATLRSMARSLRRQRSTATVSDRAGERLTDDIMQPLEHDRREGEAAAAGSGDLSGAASAFSSVPSSSRRAMSPPPLQQLSPRRGASPV